MRQLQLIKNSQRKSFGGSLLVGRRKSRRPITSKSAMHVVLRSSLDVRKRSLRQKQFVIENILRWGAQRFGVKIYRHAVVANHIHLTIKIPHRLSYLGFIRYVTGVIAKAVAIKWQVRPFTRILNWGVDFKRASEYVMQNELEARLVIPYQRRGLGLNGAQVSAKARPWTG